MTPLFCHFPLDGKSIKHINSNLSSPGQLLEKCTYKDGEKNGPYEENNAEGQLQKKGIYKDGFFFDEIAANKERVGLNARLAQMDKQMAPTQLRQNAKRAEVAEFRVQFPKKNTNGIITPKEAKNFWQRLFGGRG